jgi:glutathione S-transferase
MLSVVDKHMDGLEYLTGDFSGADIMTGHACCVGPARLDLDISGMPNVAAYVERLNSRPALQKAWTIGN